MNPIKQFQQNNGLKSDGVIGKITFATMMQVWNLSAPQLAHFLGQTHHETGGFTKTEESFNYSAKGLINTFSFYRQHPDLARAHGRGVLQRANQQAIANNVYSDINRSARFRLGNDVWGDGWKYRGRGSIQLTGKSNYKKFGKYLGVDLVKCPDDVKNHYFWEAGLWFFETNGIWLLSNAISVTAIENVTKRVNGGYNGLEDRAKWTRHYFNLST